MTQGRERFEEWIKSKPQSAKVTFWDCYLAGDVGVGGICQGR